MLFHDELFSILRIYKVGSSGNLVLISFWEMIRGFSLLSR